MCIIDSETNNKGYRKAKWWEMFTKDVEYRTDENGEICYYVREEVGRK
jgi:hypothetical protein